jgi:hypothetical protein
MTIQASPFRNPEISLLFQIPITFQNSRAWHIYANIYVLLSFFVDIFLIVMHKYLLILD